MMKDRYQKQKLLQYFISRNWYPQMEVEIFWPDSPSAKPKMITDIDVLALAPSQNGVLRPIIGDCKTLKNQSPINRVFWIKGLMSYLGADYGIVLLSKAIEGEHKLLANSLNVNLLSDSDFKCYSEATTRKVITDAALCDLERWGRYFSIPTMFPNLLPLFVYCKNGFWNEHDSAVQLRHSIAKIQNAHTELNPDSCISIFLFLELCSLFSIALNNICVNTFDKFLWREKKESFEQDLRTQLWGGYENYQFWDQLRKRLMAKTPDEPVSSLTLPEWPRFIQLVRACMDYPLELSTVPIILKELAFLNLQEQTMLDDSYQFIRTLVANNPQAAKCAILAMDYIAKASKLPPEFSAISAQIMKLQRTS